MLDLSSFIGKEKDVKVVWAQGSQYDIAVLEGFYKRCAVSCPWKYHAGRDTRTIYYAAERLGWERPSRGKVSHIAVEDCEAQIKTLVSAFYRF